MAKIGHESGVLFVSASCLENPAWILACGQGLLVLDETCCKQGGSGRETLHRDVDQLLLEAAQLHLPEFCHGSGVISSGGGNDGRHLIFDVRVEVFHAGNKHPLDALRFRSRAKGNRLVQPRLRKNAQQTFAIFSQPVIFPRIDHRFRFVWKQSGGGESRG